MLVRSVPLRSFDRDVVSKVLKVMKESVTINEGITPSRIERIENGQLRVVFSSGGLDVGSDVFDTVLAAVGKCTFVQILHCVLYPTILFD